MVYLSDPVIARLPVAETGDPLVDLREIPALRVDGRLADPDGAYARLRSDVANRLVIAQTLLPPGLFLLIVEGFRPAALQRQYFEAHVERLRATHPERDDGWLRARAGRYVSPPEVAPHVAGAAGDLTLGTAAGRELWMGTEVNDTDTEDCHTGSRDISAEARANRDVLIAALTGAGLVNYPTEWWHWSFGDRYWAFLTGAPAAHFGPL